MTGHESVTWMNVQNEFVALRWKELRLGPECAEEMYFMKARRLRAHLNIIRIGYRYSVWSQPSLILKIGWCGRIADLVAVNMPNLAAFRSHFMQWRYESHDTSCNICLTMNENCVRYDAIFFMELFPENYRFSRNNTISSLINVREQCTHSAQCTAFDRHCRNGWQ